MKSKAKRLLAGALAGALLLTGCTGGTAPENNAGAAMGRYVEQALGLPEDILHVEGLRPEGDGFSLLGLQLADSSGYKVDTLHWRLEGGAWQRQPVSLEPLEESGDYMYAAAFGPDDSYYALLEEAAGEDEEVDYGRHFQLVRQQGGEVDVLPTALGAAEFLRILDNGDILASYYQDFTLRLYSGETGAELYSIPVENRLTQGAFQMAGSILAVVDATELKLYDLATGTLRETLALTGADAWECTAIAPADETGESWYYANRTGIYKLQGGGALNERIVEGGLISASLPNQYIRQFFAGENGFAILYEDDNGQYSFYRYVWDETVPTTPDTTLRVYSLEDNATLRLAANLFQRQNPAVQVQYEYGYEPGMGATVDDALKALATQLMAGTGPDVLVMDGLPLQSYIQRGVLLDISEIADESLTGQVYENLALSQRSEGQLYTIAGRFTMPMLFALPGDAAVFDTPKALADYLTAQEVPLFGRDTAHFMEALFPLYSTRWLAEDYSLHTETLAEDLAQLKRLADLYQGYEIQDEEGNMYGGALLTGLLYPIFLAELRSLGELKGPYTNMVDGNDYELFALPDAAAPYFTPLTNLSVAAGSSQPELAMDFIRCVLSPEVQSVELEDGLPVNRAAMQASYANNSKYTVTDEEGRQYVVTWGWTYENPFTGEGDTAMVNMYWPDEDYFARYSLWEQATAPLWLDRTVLEILTEECAPYFAGERELEACMNTLAQRLNLLAAELQ